MTSWLEKLSLQTKIIAMMMLVLAIVLLLVGSFVTTLIVKSIENDVENNLLEMALFIADMEEIKEAMKAADPSIIIQPIADSVLKNTSADMIVILDMQGIRRSHINKSLIGGHITGGDEGPALKGQAYTSKAIGVSGPTFRSFAPIFDEDGTQLGVASAGKFVEKVNPILNDAKLSILYTLLIGLFIGSFGAILLSNHIKSSIFNLEPYQIAKILEERIAIIEAIFEGVIAFDYAGKVTTVNKTARKMLKIEEGDIRDLLNSSTIKILLENKKMLFDQELFINGVLVLVNVVPIKVNGKIVGTVMTFRDKTDVKRLAEELTGLKQYTEALRAQSHEFNNKLHTIYGLIQLECYDEVVEYVSEVFEDSFHEAEMVVKYVKDPTIGGLLLGKISQAKELNINFTVDSQTQVDNMMKSSQGYVTIIGNLVENGFDAVKYQDKQQRMVKILLKMNQKEVIIQVNDNGPGISPQVLPDIFEKGFSTKEGNRGIGLYLVKKEVESLGGKIKISTFANNGTEFIVVIPTCNHSGGDTQ